MNDAEFEVQQQRVIALSERWIEPLGLAYWQIKHHFYRGPLPDGNEGGDSALARCQVHWQYLHAAISWDLEKVAEESDDDLELIVVHECMHIFLHETREEDDWFNHEERVAQMLAKAFLWVRDVEQAVAPNVTAETVTSGPVVTVISPPNGFTTVAGSVGEFLEQFNDRDDIAEIMADWERG